MSTSKNTSVSHPARPSATGRAADHSAASGQLTGTLQQVQALLESGQPQQALNRVNASRTADPQLKNARGVCLLRLGEPQKALQLYRALVLQPQGILLRNDVPVVWKTNLATSLLLCGSTSGCVSILNDLRGEQHPAIEPLRRAISNWQAGLSLWQKLGWKLGLDPACPVRLDFPPGELS